MQDPSGGAPQGRPAGGPQGAARRTVSRVRGWWDLFSAEFAKFGVIGTIGVFVDSGAFWLLAHGFDGIGPLAGHEKLASLVATAIASVFSWICNRYWTFRHKRPDNLRREILLFSLFNAIGALITMGCVALVIDVLHVTDPIVQTSARLVGIVLGTLFRFWTYRQFVFVRELADLPPVPHGPDSTDSTAQDDDHRTPAAGPANGAGTES